MSSFISKEALAARRARFPKGARVELVRMSDPYTTLQPGDRGVIDFIDDAGTAFCVWDNGSRLGVVYREDEIMLVCTD